MQLSLIEKLSCPVETVVSPQGGPVVARERLSRRFASRVRVNGGYSRRIVSYQGNRNLPGFRWMKYKESFSRQLVPDLIKSHNPGTVLDPFAGACTTPLVAAANGKSAMGIEIMPVGILVGSAIAEAVNGLSAESLRREGAALVQETRTAPRPSPEFAFPHVRITQQAFSEATEAEMSRARGVVSVVENPGVRTLLDLACVSVLEDVSYTRKDGQYLRWDYRSGRSQAKMNKGIVQQFNVALEKRLIEMNEDIHALKEQYRGARPHLVTGSCLELLKDLPPSSIDMVITSPPYANRYDYTRTYALELAWLGLDQEDFSRLRQKILSATVENKGKMGWFDNIYGEQRQILDRAIQMYMEQSALHEVINILLDRVNALSNRNILRLIEYYFLEMAVVIAELGRIVRPGGVVIMVNDNVQYHGEEVPVDFILADFAEQSGFDCTNIWTLARGKGNASQQMARFGRRELRKCVYKWVRSHG